MRARFYLVVGVCLLATIPAVAQTGIFIEPPQYLVSTVTSAGAIAVGDFNGDGKLDLVVANGGASSMSVLFGNGDGTFQPHVDYGTGGNPTAVAVGDFNGDGKPDLAVAVGGGV